MQTFIVCPLPCGLSFSEHLISLHCHTAFIDPTNWIVCWRQGQCSSVGMPVTKNTSIFVIAAAWNNQFSIIKNKKHAITGHCATEHEHASVTFAMQIIIRDRFARIYSTDSLQNHQSSQHSEVGNKKYTGSVITIQCIATSNHDRHHAALLCSLFRPPYNPNTFA